MGAMDDEQLRELLQSRKPVPFLNPGLWLEAGHGDDDGDGDDYDGEWDWWWQQPYGRTEEQWWWWRCQWWEAESQRRRLQGLHDLEVARRHRWRQVLKGDKIEIPPMFDETPNAEMPNSAVTRHPAGPGP